MSATSRTLERRHQFASDNYSGICPEVLAAIEKANAGHASGYGNDAWTQKARELICHSFEANCEVFFVFNGTAANSLSLASLCDSMHSVICHEYSHIETDECNAPGFFAPGIKTIPIRGENGKLTPSHVERAVAHRDDVHHPKPRVVDITQATELGTVYSVAEVTALCKTAKKLGLHVHMDGARFANAVASLEVRPRQVTWEAGVDVLSFGGTKNGMAFGEAIVFFNRDLAENAMRRQKQAGQLASKMRFLTGQWVGLLENDAWLKNARHANSVAAQLHKALAKVHTLKIRYPCEANSVFVELPAKVTVALHERGWKFYTDVGPDGVARFMCSWDSTREDVEHLVKDIREALSGES